MIPFNQVVFVGFLKRPVWLVVLFCLGCSAQSLSPEANQRIERQVRSHFKLPDAVSVTLGTPKASEFAGYDTLPITFEGGGQKNTFDFLLSKDGKKLLRLTNIDITPEGYASSLAQDAALRREQTELMKRINVSGRPWRGAASPKVTIIVYDDFQCPYCATMYQTLFANSMKEYADRLRVVFKDYPLFEIHPWAKRAAIDSNCLAEQSNDAYWDFSDYVHANQKEISGPGRDLNAAFARLDAAALDAGKKRKLDGNILQSCLKSQPDTPLNASVKEAESLGVSSTPTLFINGDKLSGALTEPELRQEIQAALRNAELPAMAAGTAPAAAPAPAK
ncbi:MAG TPA: thioredoxin domain-containing protein [Terriglobales bacterium]|nr:thioredoxin domain-containing protein [Terriglobales bacterium]